MQCVRERISVDTFGGNYKFEISFGRHEYSYIIYYSNVSNEAKQK